MTSTSGGSSSCERGAESGSSGQRVRKRQPEGGASGLGTSPERTIRRRVRCTSGSGDDRGREERLRVGVLRPREQLVPRGDLDELPEVHHRDAVAEVLHGREVVRDEQAREAELRLQRPEEVEDGRLDRDVERRHGLVRDQQARRDAERAGQADALALPARELVRVAVAELGAQADRVEELDDAPRRAPPRGRAGAAGAARRRSGRTSSGGSATSTGPGRRCGSGAGRAAAGAARGA